MPPRYEIVVRNHGQTPAYDVRNWTHGVLAEHPLTEIPPSNIRTPNAQTVINPGAEYRMNGFFARPVSVEEYERVMEGALRFYFWGEVTYRDAFGEDRHARFRFMFGGPSARVGRIDFCEEGNEAN